MGTGPLSQRSTIAKFHLTRMVFRVRVRVRVLGLWLGLGLGLGLGIQSSPPWTFVIADLCYSGPESSDEACVWQQQLN